MPEVLFNVLTRMSRPRFFATCRQSVVSQVHPAVRHIVSVDSADNLPAVEGLPHVRVERLAPGDGQTFPFNRYFNEMYRLVEDGWVVFLDDDDVFASPWSLADLAGAITAHGGDPHVLYLWRVWFPGWGRLVPGPTFGRAPTLLDVNTAGVCFHHSHLPTAQWDGDKAGDFRVIHRLFTTIKRTAWLDRVFTAQQLTENLGSAVDRPAELELLRPADGLLRLAEAVEECARTRQELELLRAELARRPASSPPDDSKGRP